MTVDVELLAPERAGDERLVADLARIVNEAYAAGEAGLWRAGTTRTDPGEIAEAIRSGGMLAATLEGRLAGCAYVRPLEPGTADHRLISTARDQWGRGVGGALVRAAEELMGSRGATTMQLELLVPQGWIHPEKAKLRSWYTRLGYQVARTAQFEEVAALLAPGLAGPCEFLIFRKAISRRGS